MTALKLCPFCFGEADLKRVIDGRYIIIQCKNCRAQTPLCDDATNAVNIWEMRPSADNSERCVICGEIIPEGQMVCYKCIHNI